MTRRVLILCTGNSCRSQMAEAIIDQRRGDTWQASSAGTEPASQPNPMALQVLREIGIVTEGSRPQHVDDFRGEPFDLVITVCDDAADNCPVWLGQGARVHIGFPDPVGQPIEVFRQVRDDIAEQVLAYLDSWQPGAPA